MLLSRNSGCKGKNNLLIDKAKGGNVMYGTRLFT